MHPRVKRPLIVGALLIFAFTFLIAWQSGGSGTRAPSHVYSVANFNAKTEQVVIAGARLTGKGIAQATVQVLLSPNGDEKDIAVDRNGQWSYQVPPTISTGYYNLTIISRDGAKNISAIKTYLIKVVPPEQQGFENTMPFAPKEAFAQVLFPTPSSCSQAGRTCDQLDINSCHVFGESGCDKYWCLFYAAGPGGEFYTCQYRDTPPVIPTPTPTGPRTLRALELEDPKYGNWVLRLQKLGFYPARQVFPDGTLGEIVYPRRDEYEREVCSNQPCTYDALAYDEFIDGVRNADVQYILDLFNELRNDQNCYRPVDALRPYFPDPDNPSVSLIDAYIRDYTSFVNASEPYPNCNFTTIRTEISQDELERLIRVTATRRVLNTNDPFHELWQALPVSDLNPFFPPSIAIKLLATTQGYTFTPADASDTAFATLSIVPAGRVTNIGRQIAATTRLKVAGLANDMMPVRRAISEGTAVPQSAVARIAESHLDDVPPLRIVFPPRVFTITSSQLDLVDSKPTPSSIDGIGSLLGQGKYGITYGNGTIATKISAVLQRYTIYDPIHVQAEVLKNANGAGGLPRFEGMAVDNLNRVVGFQMEQVLGRTVEEGMDFTGEHLIQFMHDLADAYVATGRIHGDLATFKATGTFNGGNIMVEQTAGRLRMIDYAGVPKGLATMESELRGVVDYLFREFAGAFPSDKTTRAIGSNLDDNIMEIIRGLKTVPEDEHVREAGRSLHNAIDEAVRDANKQVRYEDLFDADSVPGLQAGGPLRVSVIETEGGIPSPLADSLHEVFTLEPTAPSGPVVDTSIPSSINEFVTSLMSSVVPYVYAQTQPEYIFQLNDLPSQEVSPGTYEITIPVDTSPGNYNLVAYMYRTDSYLILDSYAQPITVAPAEIPACRYPQITP